MRKLINYVSEGPERDGCRDSIGGEYVRDIIED